MTVFSLDWIALLWLRNCILLCLFAGGLHWWLHMRKRQGVLYRMNRKALATDPKAFLWGNQIKDNIFWSIASGVTIWTGYEAISYWIYASGRLPVVDNLWWGIASVYVLFFWSTLNFYVGHRFLHWRPMYQSVHILHHRNVDIGPWSGICIQLAFFVFFSLCSLVVYSGASDYYHCYRFVPSAEPDCDSLGVRISPVRIEVQGENW